MSPHPQELPFNQRKLQGLKHHSSLARLVGIMSFIFIPMLGGLIGIVFSRVVPTSFGVSLGLIAGGLYGLCCVGLTEYIARRSDERARAARQVSSWSDNRILRTVWLRVPFIFLLAFNFGYSAMAWGLAWPINMWIGSPESKVVTVSGWVSGGARGCPHPKVREIGIEASSRALCVSSEAREQMPIGSRLRIEGRSSALGMNVEKIYIERNAP
jgi:hypothetical protein